jgi:DNA-binding NarL/FixJ family response regulator
MAIRIYIVEDHAAMRRAIVNFIDLHPHYEVVGAAGTGEDALEAIDRVGRDGETVDLVLVDTRLPGMSGIDLVHKLRERWPDTPSLMLSGYEKPAFIDQAIKAGAKGYVVKGRSDEIPEAIERVLGGGTYVSPVLKK